MFLNDERYETENGQIVSRTEVDALGTYKYHADGFFTWCCGVCGKEHSTRAYKSSGVVFICAGGCGKKNLLVRTDIRFMNQCIENANRNSTDAEKAIKRALQHFGEGIAALGGR